MFTASTIIKAGLVATLASTAVEALPTRTSVKRALQAYSANITLHESCNANATQAEMLNSGINQAMTMSDFALQYVFANGAQDPLYLKWFGTGDLVSVTGAFQSLISSNKENVTFRCDNIDGNCGQEGWAGHWRGSNATQETVICPLSYDIREPLDQICQNGNTVAGSPLNTFWATDLIHRLFHVPTISDSEVDHYADSYNECLELAQTNASWAPFNTHSLQYFALEAYANEVAAPGTGCTGEAPAEESSTAAATATSTAATECHTHADGVEHCV